MRFYLKKDVEDAKFLLFDRKTYIQNKIYHSYSKDIVFIEDYAFDQYN